jgi:hypothetical protein
MISWIKTWFSNDEIELIADTEAGIHQEIIISRLQTKQRIAYAITILFLIIWIIEKGMNDSDFSLFFTIFFYINYCILDTKIKTIRLLLRWNNNIKTPSSTMKCTT